MSEIEHVIVKVIGYRESTHISQSYILNTHISHADVQPSGGKCRPSGPL